MNASDLLKVVSSMTHDPVHQYVTPGLTSWLVGGRPHGCVRLFSSDRDTREWITPHSHRFDFVCLVLAGTVENILFVPAESDCAGANLYAKTIVQPDPESRKFGAYTVRRTDEASLYIELPNTYAPGATYALSADEIHTIKFSRGAQVLFFEGPTIRGSSVVLEPYSNNKTVRTFSVPGWMFEREAGV